MKPRTLLPKFDWNEGRYLLFIYIYYIIIYIISLSKCSNLAREFSVVGSKQGYGYFADQEKTFHYITLKPALVKVTCLLDRNKTFQCKK